MSNPGARLPIPPSPTPLDGIRVLEMGQILAGPFAATLLGYFGAEVIKLEPPERGDPLRGLRVVRNGTSLWWYSAGRNKKSVTVDLRRPVGQQLARRLLERVDVVVENFRPGTLERWGLGPDTFEASHPELIWARISGYGQTGPAAARPGFASVCEAVGGLRHVTGFPGQPPVRANLSLGDSLAGFHAAFGVLLALLARERGEAAGRGRTGQVVDVAIYESVFNLLEAVVPEYDGAGVVRGPSGSTITGIVPSNTYPCRDGHQVVIGANADSLFRRLMIAAGRPDLAEDPRLQDNAGRVTHQEEIDTAVAAWTAGLRVAEVLERLEEARVPAGPIHTVADMMEDPQFLARELFEEVEVDGEPLKIPAILPKLSATPGRTLWPGPALGAHNREILGGWLGLADEELEALREAGAI